MISAILISAVAIPNLNVVSPPSLLQSTNTVEEKLNLDHPSKLKHKYNLFSHIILINY